MNKTALRIIVVLLALFSLFACAEKGPVLLDVRYQAPEGTVAGTPKVVVGVSPFKDIREKTSSLLGKRTIRDYLENDLVVQGTVADLVTTSLKDALKARGITVKDAAAWDLGAETIRANDVDILIGGEIKMLWVAVASQPLNVKTQADVQLRVSVADAAGKKVIRTLNLSSKVERQDMAFSFGSVENAVSEALSSALNQLLNDEEFKKKIQ